MTEKDAFEGPVYDQSSGWRAPDRGLVGEADGTLLDRYRAGEHREVWRDLRARGPLTGQAKAEAFDVARATMERVARNADLVAEHLDGLGWCALFGDLRTPPRDGDRPIVEAMTRFLGCEIPASLAAFWEIVGGIDFIWDYNAPGDMPDLGFNPDYYDVLDPLCVQAPHALDWLLEDWREEQHDVEAEDGPLDRYLIELAPDVYHKANISGGTSYGVEMPNWDTDPVFANAPHEEPLTDYLRRAFWWAGFPGLEAHGADPKVQAFVAPLRARLEPF